MGKIAGDVGPDFDGRLPVHQGIPPSSRLGFKSCRGRGGAVFKIQAGMLLCLSERIGVGGLDVSK
jgi:hypothetical protein